VLLPTLALAGAEDASTPAGLAAAYRQAVLTGDWPAARALWLPEDLAASRRLAISYHDLPFKLDSASLLVLEHERIQAGEISVSLGDISTEGSLARIRFDLQVGQQSATADYYAVRADETWRFANPATALAAAWERQRTEFLDLYIQPPGRISLAAVRLLDDFIAATCGRLEIPADRVELLREQKIRYFLGDEATVAVIVGAPTRGAALLQTDAVITSEPCHLHELAHLLVNFARQELPLYTLPFMQEGVAVALGGRWGRAPAVMQGLGRYTLQSGMLAWEELLTWDEFQGQAADWTYAPSGVLAGFLLETLGGARFLELYGKLSGGLADLRQLDRATILDMICLAAAMDLENLSARFSAHVDRLSCGGVQPAGDGRGEIFAGLQQDGVVVTVSQDDHWLYWELAGENLPAEWAVLWPDPGPDPDAGTPSRLFAERFPDREYRGELLALVCAPGEIGLYDFRTDLLTVKFVESFCPDRSLAGPEGALLPFKIRRDLLPQWPWNPELLLNRR
jgi:hypothetical protein